MTTLPALADVRAWCQVGATSVDDGQLQLVINGELDNQAKSCRIGDPADETPPVDYPPALTQAIYRRVARELSGRQVPLGIVGDPASEYGASRLATFDAEVERLEGPYRMVVFG